MLPFDFMMLPRGRTQFGCACVDNTAITDFSSRPFDGHRRNAARTSDSGSFQSFGCLISIAYAFAGGSARFVFRTRYSTSPSLRLDNGTNQALSARRRRVFRGGLCRPTYNFSLGDSRSSMSSTVLATTLFGICYARERIASRRSV